ncbi:hypothetical protein [Rahnella aceris]|uniref:hypothetical protein n=1 Tax=Rahnella sp. (strain Y9602) TaxID=2703885 RepID=UPI001C26F23F|nr:hypothetical protein [Rahnella aceris]MBU9866788.1 hypothetical protein [Rahnella aceris]
MKKLSCVKGCFQYGSMPVTKPFLRQKVRQITQQRADLQLERQRRAFEIVALRQGW